MLSYHVSSSGRQSRWLLPVPLGHLPCPLLKLTHLCAQCMDAMVRRSQVLLLSCGTQGLNSGHQASSNGLTHWGILTKVGLFRPNIILFIEYHLLDVDISTSIEAILYNFINGNILHYVVSLLFLSNKNTIMNLGKRTI